MVIRRVKSNKHLFFCISFYLALNELLLYRPVLVEKVTESDPGHYSKIVEALIGR